MTVQELLEEQFNIPGTWYDSIIIHTEEQDWWKGEYFEYNREADDFLNNEGVSVTDKYGNVEELGWTSLKMTLLGCTSKFQRILKNLVLN